MKKDFKNIHFIDCGANIGQSIDWAIGIFGRGIIIDSFEPFCDNTRIIREKNLDGVNFNLYENAVWVDNTIKKFFIQDWGARTGSSLIEGKSSTRSDRFIEMRCIDLSEWIRNNVDIENFVILKLDVEGAEYNIIPKLIDDMTFNFIDISLIEFHGNKTPNKNDSIFELLLKNKITWFDWYDHVDCEKKIREIFDK